MKDELITYEDAVHLALTWEFNLPCKYYYRQGKLMEGHKAADHNSSKLQNADKMTPLRYSAPTVDEAVGFLKKSVTKLFDTYLISFVLAKSDRNIILGCQFNISNEGSATPSITVFDPGGNAFGFDVSRIMGNIAENVRPWISSMCTMNSIRPGWLVAITDTIHIIKLAEIYRSGILNKSIEKVMERHGITGYELPVKSDSYLMSQLFNIDNLFDYE